VISAVIATTLLASVPVPSSAEPRSHYDLWEEVWALRFEGRYEEAASVADTLAAVRESDPVMPAHEIESARWLARTMHAAAALSAAEQRELARTDSLMGYLENMADHEAGVVLATQHLEIRRRLLGAEHPSLSWSLSALAQHFSDSGDVAGAIRCREEAVQISLASWGDAHPFTADYMNSLALEYRQQEDYALAEQYYLDAIEIYERGLGPDDLRVGDMMARLTFTLFRMGRYSDADALGREAIAREALTRIMAGDRDALAGLPRLRGTRAEVMLLEGLTPDALVLLGSDASEQELTALIQGGTLAEYGTIHIATHALVDDKHPEQSALVLSQVGLPDPLEAALAGERIYDGLLTAKEIVAECHLNADLVTLSACETGLGQEIVGEGYVGFAHAFLQAGARSLVVSLWKVEDTATALLMQRFYENRWGYYADERSGRIAEPLPKAEALAEAKAWLRGYEDESGVRHYEHPYYWSAFILIGDRS